MQDVVDKAAIDRAIDTLHPVDPLSYKPALTAAYNVLQHTNARIKHIILLGDGDAEDSYYPLVTQIHKAGITISTVAMCDLCNHVKHIGLAGILARQGYLDYDAVVAHFLRVNGCDRETFEQHRKQAYAVWRQRSARPWTVDFGPYAPIIDRQQAAAPAIGRGTQRAARAPGQERGRSGRAARPPGA
jgi:hypothetical protein